MALIAAKDINKFKVKLADTGNQYDFKLNSGSTLAPKHEDLSTLATSIQNADEHIVGGAHGKLMQIAEQIKALQKQAEQVLKKAQEDQMLAHAACNFEKKPGKVYHLWERDGQHQWSMLSLDDHRGKEPRGTTFMGSFKYEADRSFTKVGTKSDERIELEKFVNEMLSSPANKALGFGPSFETQ